MTQASIKAELSALEKFLSSSATNVERLPAALRSHLTIQTGLEAVVQHAVSQHRSVVIAGTAGSGKTHLLRGIDIPKKYNVIPDLSAHPETEWAKLVRGHSPSVIAGNEGAFVLAAKKKYGYFAEVLKMLHHAQRGEDGTLQQQLPIVVDAAAYDPAGHGVIASMVQLPILKAYIEDRKPELQALTWSMFQEKRVRERLARCVEAASAESDADGFTFRQLWQFMADLIEGPKDGDTWIDRVFCEATEVSHRISMACDPSGFALPGISSHLWYGDLLHVKSRFLPPAIPLLEHALGVRPAGPETAAWQRKLRALALFGLRDSPLDLFFSRGADLWSEVRNGSHIRLLKQINRYFCYGLLDLGSDLELWLQHDTERRVSKANTQASLGSVPASNFSLTKSHVIGNRPDEIAQIEGGRILLRHDLSGSTLYVTKDLVEVLLRTRSHRTLERRDVEYDWRLSRFFESVARTTNRVDRLNVASFNFQTRRARWMKWDVGNTIAKVD